MLERIKIQNYNLKIYEKGLIITILFQNNYKNVCSENLEL